MSEKPRVTKTYVYLSDCPVRSDPTKVSAYLIERIHHDSIVASMTHVGEFNIESAETDVAAFLDRWGMRTAGEWLRQRRGTHRYKRVVRGSFD